MWYNDGKFQDNGLSGYLLKPREMWERKDENSPITYSPEPANPKQVTVEQTLQVTVSIISHIIFSSLIKQQIVIRILINLPLTVFV